MKNIFRNLLLPIFFGCPLMAMAQDTKTISGSSTGAKNTFCGEMAGKANTSGSDNTFTGYFSGRFNTEGRSNTFTGSNSGRFNTVGNANTFLGSASGQANTVGSNNTFAGASSGTANTTGRDNTLLGTTSGEKNNSGSYNTYLGTSSGRANQTGNKNTFVGANSGSFNTSGSGNIAFGHEAGPTQSNLVNAGAIGSGAKVSQSNSLVLGGIGTTAVKVGIGTSSPNYSLDVKGQIRATNVTALSDARLKHNVRPLGPVLTEVLGLRAVRYSFSHSQFPNQNLPKGEQIGLLAQEMEKTYPELVSTGADGYKSVNYAQLTPVLLEAIRELKEQLYQQTQRADVAAAAVAQTVTTVEALAKRVRILEGESAQAQR